MIADMLTNDQIAQRDARDEGIDEDAKSSSIDRIRR
jgi:hypothetical protein